MKYYHGTTAENAQRIVEEGRFLASSNFYDWLGPGAYFFQDAPLLALTWALELAKKTDTSPAVIELEIDLTHCFDLLRNDHSKLLAAFRNCWEPHESLKNYRAQKSPILRRSDTAPYRIFHGPVDQGEALKSGFNWIDCDNLRALLEYLNLEEGQAYSSVRSPFWAGAELYEGSSFFDHSHIQVCVLAHDDPQVDGSKRYVRADTRPLIGQPRIMAFDEDPHYLVDRYIRQPR